jgi:hypothetical protein
LRGGNREAGTSYSAAHFGQAIRMKRIMKQYGDYWNGGAAIENKGSMPRSFSEDQGDVARDDSGRRKR